MWSTAIARPPCASTIRSPIFVSSSNRLAKSPDGRHTAVRTMANTGGHVLMVGPTVLLLYKAYGIEGGVLFPVYQRTNGSATRKSGSALASTLVISSG